MSLSGLRTTLAVATAASPMGSELVLAPNGSYSTPVSRAQLAQDYQRVDEKRDISHTNWAGAVLSTEGDKRRVK